MGSLSREFYLDLFYEAFAELLDLKNAARRTSDCRVIALENVNKVQKSLKVGFRERKEVKTNHLF